MPDDAVSGMVRGLINYVRTRWKSGMIEEGSPDGEVVGAILVI
jgi:hypothetical protein